MYNENSAQPMQQSNTIDDAFKSLLVLDERLSVAVRRASAIADRIAGPHPASVEATQPTASGFSLADQFLSDISRAGYKLDDVFDALTRIERVLSLPQDGGFRVEGNNSRVLTAGLGSQSGRY